MAHTLLSSMQQANANETWYNAIHNARDQRAPEAD